MRIIAINKDIGSAFVKDNNKMYRVDINPIPLFVEINEKNYNESKAFMHGYMPLSEPINIKDRSAVFKYIAKEWVNNSDKKTTITTKEEYIKLKRERLEIILECACPKGIKNVMLPKVRKYIKDKQFEMAKLYLEVLLDIKNISAYDDVKNNNELYDIIQKLNKEFNIQKLNKVFNKLMISPQNTSNTCQPKDETYTKFQNTLKTQSCKYLVV